MILEAVPQQEGVFEAEQLLEQVLRADHRISKATIYRNLKHLQEAKIISEVLIDSKYAHYELTFGRSAQEHLWSASRPEESSRSQALGWKHFAIASANNTTTTRSVTSW